MGGSIFLTLFFGLFIAVGVGILGYGLYSWNLANRAEHWPTAQGQIISSDFVIDSDSDGATYRTKLAYSYDVLGSKITGDKIAFGYAGSSSEQFHRDIYNALPIGAQVAVRYDPANPERAVLSFGVNQSIKFFILFGGIWTIFTLGMIAMFAMGGQGATTLMQNMIIYSTP